jgi:hypothetical protein
MAIRKPGLSDSDLFRRAQEPAEAAEQRRRAAKLFLKAQQERDEAMTARLEKQKAARLAAQAAMPVLAVVEKVAKPRARKAAKAAG